METNLIPAVNANLAAMSFKNPKLTAAAAEYLKLYDRTKAAVDTANARGLKAIEDYSRRTAIILATLERDKALSEDGYKSPNEFAVKALGLKSGTASQLVTAGRMYISDKASAAVKTLSPANYRAVATIPMDKLNADMEAGTISPESKQADLKAYATANAESKGKDKPQVLKRYDAYLTGRDTPFVKVTETDITLAVCEMMTGNDPDAAEPEVIKLPSDADKNPRRLFLTPTRALVVTLKPISEQGAKKATAATRREEMIARMRKQGLSDEQIAEILD